MIDRTFSNSLSIADIAPAAATRLPEPSRGSGAFGEALAGAHTVHDRRESQATSHSRREWAHGDRTATRSRGTDRADEVRSDRAAESGGTETSDAVKSDAPADDASVTDAPATDAATQAPSDDAAAATTLAADTSAAAPATIAVAAAPVTTDLDAIVVPSTTGTVQAETDAVDAAMRLAIDADAGITATVADDALAADADADVDLRLAATLAQGAEDAETGEAKAPTEPGPMRLATSTPVTTSGPSPVQVDGSVEADAADVTKPVVTTQVTQQVAASPAADVAEGTEGDAVTQLAHAAAVTDDAEVNADAEADPVVQLKAGRLDASPTTEAGEAADADAELVSGATGRANATTHVQNPTAQAQVQANAQAQARLADAAAEEGGDAAPVKLEPLSTAQPLTAGARDAQVAAGVRVREGMLAGAVQDRIDHIADQLATRLRLSQAAGGSQVQLSLRPRELGEVTVQMKVREGVVAATILVDKADTLRTLQANIEDLKRSLENQGLAIEEFSVDVRGEAGAGGANARAAADLRQQAARTSSGSTASVAGAASVTPGLSGDLEVDPDSLHDGDLSVLA